MSQKNLLFFIILISVVVILSGCVNPPKTEEKEGPSYIPSVFSANLTFSKPLSGGRLVLAPGEQVTAYLTFANKGNAPARNVKAILYGCNLDISSNTGEEVYTLDGVNPDDTKTLTWQIVVPEDYTGKCSLTARICFDYTTEGYKEIEIGKQGEVSSSRSVEYTSPGPINLSFNFADRYVVYKDYSPMTFKIKYRNVGGGRIQYVGEPDKTDHVDYIEMTVRDGAAFLGGDFSGWTHVEIPKYYSSLQDAFYKEEFVPAGLSRDYKFEQIFNREVYDMYIKDKYTTPEDILEQEEVDFGFYTINYTLSEDSPAWNLSMWYDEDHEGKGWADRNELKFVGNTLEKRATFYINKSAIEGSETFNVGTKIKYSYCITTGTTSVVVEE